MPQPNKPAVRTAFKAIRPTKPVTIAPPVVSTTTPKPTPVVPAAATNRSAPPGPKQIVDIEFYVELQAHSDRDNFGWAYLLPGSSGRALTVVLNTSTWLVEAAISKGNSRLTTFLIASVLIERIRSAHHHSPVHQLFHWLKGELIPAEVQLRPENSWLAMRLVASSWFSHPIGKLPIFGINPVMDHRHLIAIIKASIPLAHAAQPWRPFPDKKKLIPTSPDHDRI